MLPFFTVIMIFVVCITVYRMIIEQRRIQRENEFWDREEDAEHVPPVDLATLSYIHMPPNGFPLVAQGEEAEAMEAELLELSQKPLLNLSGMTNTDLKMTYGTANFEKMQEIGEDFDRLEILIVDYSKLLMEQGKFKEATEALEFGIEIKTDISSNFTLLGECYEMLKMTDQLKTLIETAENSKLLLKTKVLDSLYANLNALTSVVPENFNTD